jgi:hypothetical protein
MIRKFIAKLREKISPAKKSAPSAAAPAPVKPAAREHDGRRQGGEGARRGDGQGRGGHGRSQGEGRGQGRSGRGVEPRRDFQPRGGERGGAGGGRGEGGGGRRDDFRGDSRGPREPRERPAIDKNYDHPRAASIKPKVAVDVPKMDTAFSKLGLSDALAFGVQEMGYLEPTPIQAQAIPVVLSGRDLIG